MRTPSPSAAFVGAGVALWTMVGCTGDDNGGSCGDAAPGDVSTDTLTDTPTDPSRDSPLSDRALGDQANVDALADATDTAIGTPDASGNVEAGPTAVASTSVAAIRMANWSPDSPPVDFCLAPHGTGIFQGPILAGQVRAQQAAGIGDGGTVGLAFAKVSSYSFVKPGQYDARLVVFGALDCSAGVVDGSALPALAGNAFETIALVGEANRTGADPGLQVVGFLDDQNPSGPVALRFIHAAPGLGAVDFGTLGGTSTKFSVLLSGVQFGKAGTTQPDGGVSTVDLNGYLARPPMSAVALSVRPHGVAAPDGSAQDLAVASSVSAAAGSVLTIVAVGAAGVACSANAGAAACFLECVDNAGTIGPFSSCNIVSR
jgi:hypothetical protein